MKNKKIYAEIKSLKFFFIIVRSFLDMRVHILTFFYDLMRNFLAKNKYIFFFKFRSRHSENSLERIYLLLYNLKILICYQLFQKKFLGNRFCCLQILNVCI